MIRIQIFVFAAVVAATGYGAEFSSDFANTPDRVWVGADYWANPMEDWSIEAGRLQCRGGGNRNVTLLTREVTGTDAFEMAVRVGRVSGEGSPGTVGFRLGIRDEVDDYRAAALRGKGLNAGLDPRAGTLFIGKSVGQAVPNSVPLNGLTLKLSGAPSGNKMALKLSALDQQGEVKASVDATLPADSVRGLVALVNNHDTKDKAAFWFSDWTLQGAGIRADADRVWGPILWTMHTLHHTPTDAGTVLKLTAQLAPDGGEGSRTAALTFSARDDLCQANVDPLACTATFRVTNWVPTKESKFTVRYGSASYSGTIRAEPSGRPLVVAGFTGNQDYLFPNNAVV